MNSYVLTGLQALKSLQAIHPDDWESKVAEANSKLKFLKATYGTSDFETAYSTYLFKNPRPANHVAMVYSLYLMDKTTGLSSKHIQLESRAYRIEVQLAAMKADGCKLLKQHKKVLFEFYHGQLAAITDEIKKVEFETNLVINEMPVFGVIQI